jgi:hypothetical protein
MSLVKVGAFVDSAIAGENERGLRNINIEI